ncbi:hypothetical protein RRG08_006980, partial [Elysia crispata]
MGCGGSKDDESSNNTKKESPAAIEKSALDKFREAALIAHNNKRALHGAPPLKL